ncbi:DUF2141 domain-containing protein [Novosphingobium sp. FSY-8]|uniref:DUF2141 domain-containing protein n=1 Tax=Novosphingobium ovatum TaxID=1908523 RepID=A0ABW9XH24_9SPHN|nr:DUF2141 domain-containing protein [Novosphingobium ovatum]NBC37860.1 DUF2141 domain-containing protein [Novosphingobium ovatum]
MSALLALIPLLAADAPKPSVPLPSTPELGKAEGKCRPGESGPSLMVEVVGLKDRTGRLKLEIYPNNDADFLMDDNVLVYQGKAFRRVEEDLPPTGPVRLCIRVPAPGTYSLMLLHDRDNNRKFGWWVDGIGFGSNPRLGWSKPKAAHTGVAVGAGPTPTRVVLNYRSGLGVAPIDGAR